MEVDDKAKVVTALWPKHCVQATERPVAGGHNAWAMALSSTSKFVGFAVVG